MNQLVTQLIVILIMAGGFAMLIGVLTGTSLVGRMYRWLLRVMVLNPLRWGLRQIGIATRQLIRWGGRQIGRLLLYLARLTGRGIRYAWVRLTT